MTATPATQIGTAPTQPEAQADTDRALTVLHQDRWLVAVHKPAGLLVHRTALDAQAQDDLLTRLQTQMRCRLWPAHRLDKGTSGVLLLARDADTASALGHAFALGQMEKSYLALVRGWPAEQGEVQYPLAKDPEIASTGQTRLAACTRWTRLACHLLDLPTQAQHPQTRVALLAVVPLTGRRHQIRRHFKHLGHPLIGDATHGKGPLNRALADHLQLARLWLHAQQLSLVHPATGERLALHAPAGPEWARWLSNPEAIPRSVSADRPPGWPGSLAPG